MKTGVFGGTFDPPHKGHLRLARLAERSCSLDRILFVPCARQPFKSLDPGASAWHRCAMLALALEDEPKWLLDAREMERGGISYTIKTLELLRLEQPKDQFFLILGEDNLNGFSRWRRPMDIAEMATLVVAPRGGACGDSLPPELRRHVIFLRSRPLDISSSGVRARIAGGRPWRYLVPASVARYIERQGLYKFQVQRLRSRRHM